MPCDTCIFLRDGHPGDHVLWELSRWIGDEHDAMDLSQGCEGWHIFGLAYEAC
jgi:hypothetical protein